MNLGQHQEIFSAHLANLIHYAIIQGYGVRIGEVQRTPEQQKIYMQQGRSKTMNSMHLKKCAADLFFTRNGVLLAAKSELQQLGNYWESLCADNSWGGNWNSFKDLPHFQRTVK